MKNKTIILLVYLLIICISLSSCNGNIFKKENKKQEEIEVALIIDLSTIEDKSYNQGIWESIQRHCKKNKMTCNYYKPNGTFESDYHDVIETAVNRGAKVIVAAGFWFETPIYNAQKEYKDVKFVIIDGIPNSGEDSDENHSKYEVASNTVALTFKEEEAGYLAGYSAVKNGYRNLGFIGGMPVPSVVNFGYGYIEGAKYAAEELNTKINIMYQYSDGFVASDLIEERASAWYETGTEIIFAAGGGLGISVMEAAKKYDGDVIGVDVDQSDISETVKVSAIKKFDVAVYNMLEEYKSKVFVGGRILREGIAEDAVGLSLKNMKYDKFSAEDYDEICKKILDGTIKISNNPYKYGENKISELNSKNIEIYYCIN